MYAFVPARSTICPRCSQPSLQTCSVCNTSFLCEEEGQCQKAIIHNFTDKRILYRILRVMGSAKTKTPCPEHICGGTETRFRHRRPKKKFLLNFEFKNNIIRTIYMRTYKRGLECNKPLPPKHAIY